MIIKRKLLGYAYSKLLCLPAFWVKMNSLERGDTVTLELDKRGNLIVRGKDET